MIMKPYSRHLIQGTHSSGIKSASSYQAFVNLNRIPSNSFTILNASQINFTPLHMVVLSFCVVLHLWQLYHFRGKNTKTHNGFMIRSQLDLIIRFWSLIRYLEPQYKSQYDRTTALIISLFDVFIGMLNPYQLFILFLKVFWICNDFSHFPSLSE